MAHYIFSSFLPLSMSSSAPHSLYNVIKSGIFKLFFKILLWTYLFTAGCVLSLDSLKEKLWKLLTRSVLTFCLTRFRLWLSTATRTLSLGSFLSQTWAIWPITEWWWWRGRGTPVTWMTQTPGTKLSHTSLVRCKGSQRGSVDSLQHNNTTVTQRSLATKTNTKYWSYM